MLLGPQKCDVDRARVVGLQQLPSLGLELGQLPRKEFSFRGIAVLAGGYLGLDRRAKAVGPLGRQLDAVVELLDLALQLLGGDVRLSAAGRSAPVLLAEAVEV